MSDSLSSLAALAPGASSILGALDGVLQIAAWRGVTFSMVDSRHEAGRRWQRFLFPGRDDTVHEDLGAIDGEMQVNALHIGDDYVRWQRRMEAACKAEGPGILRHPWLGQRKVVLSQKASFAFSETEFRVCRVTLTFEPWQQAKPPQLDTLGSLLDQLDTALDAGRLMLADLLAPLGQAAGVLGLLGSVCSRFAGVWDMGFGTATSGLSGVADAPLSDLYGGVAIVPGVGLADQVAGLLAAVPAAVSDAVDAAPAPALGPGPDSPALATPDPRAATALLLATAPLLVALPGEPDPAPALAAIARMQVVVEAVRAASFTSWTSRDDAIAARVVVDAALATVQLDMQAQATVRPLAAGVAWQAVRQVRSAWNADLQERGGRLPSVGRLVTILPMSAWQIALIVAGDNPAAIRPTMLDLVARNRVRNPAAVPAGTVEYLVQA